jgi:3-oxoacyl-[acyl-carrier protein] reductase
VSPEERRWVIVAGAGGAIGSVLALHYAKKGFAVLGLDRRFDRFDSGTLPDDIVLRSADLCAEDQVQTALDEALGTGGRIHLLINAVGEIWNEPIISLQANKLVVHRIDNWRRVAEANLIAPFIMATLAAARMVRTGGGSIVNFSSIASSGNAGQAAYGAAKAGIEGLTRAMAVELGPLGVRVNAVSLGFVDVESTRGALSANTLRDYAQRTPLRRLGGVADVINAVEFLERNEFVNREILNIDGGLRL